MCAYGIWRLSYKRFGHLATGAKICRVGCDESVVRVTELFLILMLPTDPPRCCEFRSYKNPEFHLPMSKSLVYSKLNQLLAILGATFSRFGTIPLYMPLNPSVLTIDLTASKMPEY